MKKILSIAIKSLALLICVGAYAGMSYLNNNVMRFELNAVALGREERIACLYAFLILLPLLSFCMAVAFEGVYAPILVFIFICAFPVGIYGVLRDISAVLPSMRISYDLPYYELVNGFFVFIFGLIVISFYTIPPYLISNFAIKQGHKVYLRLWGQGSEGQAGADTEQLQTTEPPQEEPENRE